MSNVCEIPCSPLYLVDHPAATPPNFYGSVNYNLSTKKWKNKREQYLKPEKSKQLTILMRFSGLSI
jgi:hypothetical protein